MGEKQDEALDHAGNNRISFVRSIIDQAGVTQDALNYTYPGEGTAESPYLVDFIPNDPFNPMMYWRPKKWAILMIQAVATLSVSFSSSAFSGGIGSVVEELGVSEEVAILGVSMFVLGFAIGPLFWAPLSEMYGRQIIFFISYMGLTAFNGGAAGAKTVAGMIVLRFFAGAFGSSPLTNAGGVIADMFAAEDRGAATCLFAMAPLFGPALGPMAGGFLGEKQGWRWVQGMITIFTGVIWIVSTLTYPETYPPYLLQQRAKALSKITGKVYISKLDVGSKASVAEMLKTALLRPWILLFKEPIVLITAVYMAIIYGTMFLCFAAFPIIYQLGRGWSPGVGGLAFIGLLVGMSIALAASLHDNKRYEKISAAHNGAAPPEARLPPAIIGSVLLPAGMFWFAWTNGPSVHWIVSIIASSFFGAGMVLIFLSLAGYLIDSYLIFAASALAANSVIRSVFGAVFPLFTTSMYKNLGIHWASSIPAFLSLACLPFPFLFYRYGDKIRMRCQYAAEAAALLEKMRKRQDQGQSSDEPPMEEFELERVASSVRRAH